MYQRTTEIAQVRITSSKRVPRVLATPRRRLQPRILCEFTLRAPPGNTREHTAMPPTTLRVATLNVHGWHNESDSSWEGLVHLLQATAPDVVALQEATKHRGAPQRPSVVCIGSSAVIALLSRYPPPQSGRIHPGGKPATKVVAPPRKGASTNVEPANAQRASARSARRIRSMWTS